VFGVKEISSTWETVHGLLHLGPDGLAIQWRVMRSTDRVGLEIRTDREIEPVQNILVPLSAIAGASIRWRWLSWPPGRYLVIQAADLEAFEEVVGPDGLELDHPAELAFKIGRGKRWYAREFAGDVELAVADRAIRAAEGRLALPGSQATELPSEGPSRGP
jgi:hypothetical protein